MRIFNNKLNKKITIDGVEVVGDAKNIVELAKMNGIKINAPCYDNNKHKGCCKSCLVEINNELHYACYTKPVKGMNIIYDRKDLKDKRKENLQKYAQSLKEEIRKTFKE